MDDFSPRLKLWVESGGRLVMSDYRVRLLELVGESGSLAHAAEQMGLSYRRAWGKVKELEANLGLALVQSEVGGAGGGHTVLSEEGRALVAAYRRFQERMARELDVAFREEVEGVLGGGTGPPGGAPLP
ncbi:MAG: LysR family transcriptional regulator [Chloroflexi bacterium]|nr:LysR family transcriptional regulator [Chloroflexota bacterium]